MSLSQFLQAVAALGAAKPAVSVGEVTAATLAADIAELESATAAAVAVAKVAGKSRKALVDNNSPYVALVRHVWEMWRSQRSADEIAALRAEVADRAVGAIRAALDDAATAAKAVAAARKKISRAFVSAGEYHSGQTIINGKPVTIDGLAVNSVDAITSADTYADRTARARHRARAESAAAEMAAAIDRVVTTCGDYVAARDAGMVAKADAALAALVRSVALLRDAAKTKTKTPAKAGAKAPEPTKAPEPAKAPEPTKAPAKTKTKTKTKAA